MDRYLEFLYILNSFFFPASSFNASGGQAIAGRTNPSSVTGTSVESGIESNVQ